MLIRHLFQLLNEQPRLLETLTYEQISRFIRLTIALKNDIIAAQPSEHDPSSPPGRLPVYQCNFLSQICDIPQQYINTCWIAVSSIVWGHLEDESERYNDKDFEAWDVGDEFGLCEWLTMLSFITLICFCSGSNFMAPHSSMLSMSLDISAGRLPLNAEGDGTCEI
ncbi:MAG: hypothetical protein NXY57DRAFT_1027134 [Lentinula lateritia]|nr:MAG: hypothetical protein NXY57DRAFT_1027134 [Lentinula lateritia]